jgi:hypothetical protein
MLSEGLPYVKRGTNGHIVARGEGCTRMRQYDGTYLGGTPSRLVTLMVLDFGRVTCPTWPVLHC